MLNCLNGSRSGSGSGNGNGNGNETMALR